MLDNQKIFNFNIKNNLKMFFKFLFLSYNLFFFTDALSSDKIFRPTQQEILNPNATPLRSVYGIKSIQTDYWNTDDSSFYFLFLIDVFINRCLFPGQHEFIIRHL